MTENRKILNTSDLDGFDKRKLPSPGFQVEVVLVDHDDPAPAKPPSPTTNTGPNNNSTKETSSTQTPKQTKETGSNQDKDDVFSDSDSESSKNRRAKATNDDVETSSGAKESKAKEPREETSNLARGIKQVSLDVPEPKSGEKVKSSSAPGTTSEAGSTGMSEFQAIAADASVFSFGDEDDYYSE